ncbi:universal stress protein [Mesorhizobium sp. SP-1A]|jgi:nucleotide-binding universal stress UspA family protein|uniref:universal stress protein n=1 Tax=Mesorhizobium sp. SP-1A TaxID=3077840 RepID=UPI0028F6EC7C|nr:universal stress protein [Mesorhizobium sp. SP-1A]
MYKHILVPTDGSETAWRGVEEGLRLAKALGSKVTAVTATEPFPASGLALGAGWVPTQDDMDYYNTAHKQAAMDILQAVKASAQETGVDAAIVYVPYSRPSDAIVETAQQRGCDVIVIASHGRRGINKLLLGSQATEVLARARMPVLIVK